MKIIVDNVLPVSEFGRRSVKTDQVRYYYQVVGYDCLVLVCHDQSYPEWCGETAVALFNFDKTDGRIICDLFPKAPAAWRDEPHLVQVTIRSVRKMPPGPERPFGEAVREMLGDGC